jgi:hypothetical protein
VKHIKKNKEPEKETLILQSPPHVKIRVICQLEDVRRQLLFLGRDTQKNREDIEGLRRELQQTNGALQTEVWERERAQSMLWFATRDSGVKSCPHTSSNAL